jgi:hypothetical protein
MSGVFLIIFTLFWSGITLMFDGMMGYGAYRQFESGNYPGVTGKVISSEVKSHQGSKGGTTYSADIQYSYMIEGRHFTGSKWRFNNASASGYSMAMSLVQAHPAGSELTVFYNPTKPEQSLLSPGIEGQDFLLPLFMTPFNAVMVGFWAGIYAWARERFFRPIAGGVKIITDPSSTRIRLPQFSAFAWGLVTAGGLGFVSIFVVGFSTNMHPSIPVALLTIGAIYLTAAVVYVRQWRIINSGVDDLVIRTGSGTIDLPLTQGRKEKATLGLKDIQSVWVETIVHTSSKGGVSYTYAPTLRVRGAGDSSQKLADWSDKLKANDFADWLAKKLGVAREQ